MTEKCESRSELILINHAILVLIKVLENDLCFSLAAIEQFFEICLVQRKALLGQFKSLSKKAQKIKFRINTYYINQILT